MKLSRIYFGLSLVLVIISLIVLIPSSAINVGGNELQFPEINKDKYCFGKTENEETGEVSYKFCLLPLGNHFENSVSFVGKQRIRYEFIELNSAEVENKDQIVDNTITIIRQRLKIIDATSYTVTKVKTEEGKYFVEIDMPRNEENYLTMLDLVISAGEVFIYQDIEGYKPDPEAEQSFDFLEGKMESPFLSLDDIISVKHYYEPLAIGGNGGFVVELNFGNENVDNVAQAAEPSFTAETLFRGIQLVQNGFPIGVQAAPVRTPEPTYGGGGQSYVLFTDLGNPNNALRTKAIAAVVSTDAILTQLTVSGQVNIPSEVNKVEVNYIKLIIPFVILMTIVFCTILFKYNGFMVSIVSVIYLIFGLAFIKFTGVFGLGASVLVILSAITAMGIGILFLSGLFRKNPKKNFVLEYLRKKRVFVITFGILMLLGSITLAVITGFSNSIREVMYTFAIFSCIFIFVFEVVLRGIGEVMIDIRSRKENK